MQLFPSQNLQSLHIKIDILDKYQGYSFKMKRNSKADKNARN